MALSATATAALPQSRDVAHLRRCWYRRLIHVTTTPDHVYAVECLYPTRQVSVPLGDLETARPICNSCQAEGVFRPDEE
ncbi:MAG: hypothetical protein M3O90_03665 [Actinomycetota bacterium]|nr:hypothetical protein [Actinomycetota bacterium]